MLTIRNIRNVVMLASVPSRPINFRADSPLAKLITKLPPETGNPEEALAYVASDEKHESILSAQVAEMTPLIIERVSFIRNTISAQIEEIVNKVESTSGELSAMYLPIKVVTTRVPNILNSEFMTTFTREFRDARVETANTPRSGAFPAYSSEELIQRMCFLTGDEELAKDVADLVDSTAVSVVTIYNKWFRGEAGTDYPTPTALVAPAYIPFMYIEWAIVFLLAKGFYKNTDGNVNMRIEDYNLYLLRQVANLGKYIHNALPLIKKTYGETGKAYVGVSQSGTNTAIIMNGVVYANAVTAGTLTDQIVIGAQLIGKITDLNNNDELDIQVKERALAVYNSKLATYQSLSLDRYKANVMVEMMRCILNDIDNNEYACADMSKQDIITKCRSLIDEYSVLGPDRLFLMVRSVVAKGLYPYSGAFAYFTAMDGYQKLDSTIDPRVAATLATRDVIIEYCVNQIAGVK